MGKKKNLNIPSKKVAEIAGASTTTGDTTQPPRKRGRPRKIVEEKTETEDEQGEAKIMKTGEDEVPLKQQVMKGIGSSSSSAASKESGAAMEGQEGGKSAEEKPKEPEKSSRGRRKGQPRKSS